MKNIIAILALVVASQAQTLTASFDGQFGAPNAHSSYNMSMAVNGTYVMEVTGANQVCIYNYSGVLQGSCVATATFVTNAGLTVGSVLDPRITYDTFISRWIMGCSCSNDFLIVSSGSDPTTATWKGVQLSTRTGDLTMKPGYDKNWVGIAEYDPSTTKSVLFAIPQADVAWTGAGNVSLTHMVTSGTPMTSEDWTEIDTNPSKPVSGTGSAFYFVSRVGQTQNQTNGAITIALDTFTPTSATAGSFNAPGSPSTISTPYLYNTPISVPQPTSPHINGLESHRPQSVVAFNGTDLWMLYESGPCASSCGSQGTDTQNIFFVYNIALPGLTLTQSAKINNSSLGFIFPSLAVDSSGNVGITAMGSSTSQNASIYTWYHLTTDAAGVVHGPTLQVPGTAVFNCNSTDPVGWGYTSGFTDPGDPTKLWAVEEYANSATNCVWYTHLIQMSIASVPPGVAATGNLNGVSFWGASK